MSTIYVDPFLVAVLRTTCPGARAVSGLMPRMSPIVTIERCSRGHAHMVVVDLANEREEYVSPPMPDCVLTSEENLREWETYMHRTMVAPFN